MAARTNRHGTQQSEVGNALTASAYGIALKTILVEGTKGFKMVGEWEVVVET